MSISIQNICSASSEEWDYIWKQCDYSTYFHSREWAEIWNEYSKGKMRPDPQIVIFNDGKRAILPLSYQKNLKGLVKRYFSSPAGTFGGWISADDLDKNHGILLAEVLTKKHNNLIWRMNPYDKLVFESGVRFSKYDETHSLNLEGGFDALYKQWTKGHASAARKAHKAGIAIKIAENLDDWKEYYRAYQDSLRRWGNDASSAYSWKLFEILNKRNSLNIKLWLAIYEGKMIAGSLCFYAKNHVVYWHGAAYSAYFKLRPVNLLMYEVIKNACNQRYFWFDFNPSGGNEGVKNFKKSFGAKPMNSSVYRSSNYVDRMVEKILGWVKQVEWSSLRA